jgi:ATP-dependent Clp protease ATP-binding subunit ClpC
MRALVLLWVLGLVGLGVWVVSARLRETVRAVAARFGRRRGEAPAPSPLVATAAGGGEGELGALVRQLAPSVRADVGEYPGREDLVASTVFQAAVDRVRRRAAERAAPVEELTRLGRDADRWVSRLALAALAGRSDLPADWSSLVVRRLRQAPYDQAWLFLRSLEAVPDPVIGPVLSQLEYVQPRDVAELIAARVAAGREQVDEETLRRNVPLRHAGLIEAMIDDADDLVGFLREPFEAWRAATVDVDFVEGFARVWSRPFDAPPALVLPARGEVVAAVYDAVTATPPQPLLLVGEHGAGKTALVRAALEQLPPHWIVFEATAASVNAGAIYVGELEGRVEQLVQNLGGRPVVWVLPALEETLYAGRYSQSPLGLLDHLLPHLQAGALRVVAETSPAGYEAIAAARPNAATVFEALRVRPLGDRDAVAVARHAFRTHRYQVAVDDEVLAEAFELAQQFLPGAAPPGNLVRLLEQAADAVAERGQRTLSTGDVLATLAASSGLPLALLDAARPLDLAEVRAFFEARVLGQREAVEALVERIALIKAGLTDPTRPLGVFLFVGPTGTGKTEIAKALAELLFGSPQRLVRLDMSEYQTPDSLERLVSDTSLEAHGSPLVASVRKDPFSVVLLDEFEKAAAPIWDLFLQVFDDGRLTDRHGRVVDFRRCVIILTANIGSSIESGPGVGFGRTRDRFRPAAVERAVAAAFRPEFVNRLDRVVVFRPFERAQMRALLEKELAEAIRRRGLRRRPWAVEFDESALSFLIDRGFSPELGARPLKRAVERYLLVPLANAIVEQAVPEGEQFLFVTAPAGEIQVRFVDPDEDEPASPSPPAPSESLDLRALTLSPRTDAEATAFLLGELRRIEDLAAERAVSARKDAALAGMAEPGFWEQEGRFRVLAEVEYLDRFEAALRTAAKLAERLEHRNGRGGASVTALLASRLYVLECALAGLDAGAPADVFVRVRPAADSGGEAAELIALLEEMYARWAERRGMRLERVGSDGRHDVVLSVSGLGAGHILSAEAGLHVLEDASGPDGGTRIAAAVEVAPSEPAADRSTGAVRAGAEAAFASTPLPTQVVRRYRRHPSPLVRDSVRGYRTGRIDRVLDGDFDLF